MCCYNLLPIQINHWHRFRVCVYAFIVFVIDKSNIALGCCLFPFCMRNILLKLNKSTNCVVRHDLRFNRGIPFSIAHSILFFFFVLFSTFRLHYYCYCSWLLFFFVAAILLLLKLSTSSLCHALRFRSLHKYSLISSSRNICLRIYGFSWKYGNTNLVHINT